MSGSYFERTPRGLANLIMSMTYGDLVEVSRVRKDMNSDAGMWDLSDHKDWAAMLHAWAESQLEPDGPGAADADA